MQICELTLLLHTHCFKHNGYWGNFSHKNVPLQIPPDFHLHKLHDNQGGFYTSSADHSCPKAKCSKTIHCWRWRHFTRAFTPMFEGWLVRSLVHGLVLMMKHEKFFGQSCLSMLSWEITLHLPPQSTSHLLMIYVYIPDVVNTILGFTLFTFYSDYSMP